MEWFSRRNVLLTLFQKNDDSTRSAYRKQFKFTLNLLFMNLYGPKDNFNLKQSHVIPAIIKKIYSAKRRGKKFIELWDCNQRRISIRR